MQYWARQSFWCCFLAPQCLPGTWSRQLRPRSYQNCIMEDKFSTKQQTKPKEPDIAFRHIWDIFHPPPRRFWSDTLCCVFLWLYARKRVSFYICGAHISHYCQSRSTTLIIFLIIVYCQSSQLPPSTQRRRPIQLICPNVYFRILCWKTQMSFLRGSRKWQDITSTGSCFHAGWLKCSWN